MSLDPADPWREWAFGEFLAVAGHGQSEAYAELAGLNYEELEALVRSWPWWSPDPVLVGTVQLISGLTRGLGLPGIVLARGSGHTLVTIHALVTGRRVPYSCYDATPLVAALMVCWRALLGEGQTPPPELDELISGAILRGELLPGAFGVSWAEVELLYRDRPCPPEVLAHAAVELALGHGGRRVP